MNYNNTVKNNFLDKHFQNHDIKENFWSWNGQWVPGPVYVERPFLMGWRRRPFWRGWRRRFW
jgi:hypothetical protein